MADATAYRLDLSALRPAKRMPDGRIRADAHITRAGIFEYLNQDGTIRRELRPASEVFSMESLDSFAQVPVTNNHPSALLTSADATRYMVGSTGENVTRDDDYVRTSLMVADADTVAQIEAGKVQVSCGYSCRIDATPGVDPVHGAYDVKQYMIRGNHVAIVDTARAGDRAAMRLDRASLTTFSARMDGVDVGVHADALLNAEERSKLRSSSFAVPGRSGLPIENAVHVRAAMARFGEYKFTDAAERKTAYDKIVSKAKDLGIDSSGFEKANRTDTTGMEGMGPMVSSLSMSGTPALMGKKSTDKRTDGLWVTSVVDGHGHVIDPECMSPGGVGYTSGADTTDGDYHSHAWLLGQDGSVAILDNAGHTHDVAAVQKSATDPVQTTIVDLNQAAGHSSGSVENPAARGDSTCRPAIPVHTGGTMPDSKNQANKADKHQELLAAAATQLATEKERADRAESQLQAETARADSAEGTVSVLKAQLATATESRIDASEVERRDATIHTLQKEVGSVKTKLAEATAPKFIQARVNDRVKLVTAAGAVLGDARLDGFSDRELMDAVIERLMGKKTEADRSDDYARACFDTAVSNHYGSQDAIAALRAAAKPASRVDGATTVSAATARQQMIDRIHNASKPRDAAQGTK